LESIDIALIGVGQWGYNYLATLATMEQAKVRWCCDSNPNLAPVLDNLYPQVRFTTLIDDVLEDNKVIGVVVATPPQTHYSISKVAIDAGKNILVEKPFTLNYCEADELVALARSRQLTLMAGHIMEYHPAISWIKNMMAAGELGRILYLYFQRVNLGNSRHKVNVLWDLAIHDFSIIRYLLDVEPLQISTHGACHLYSDVSDVIFVTMKFPDNLIAQIHVSSINPLKSRTLAIVGEKKTLIFDDLKSIQQIQLYNRGIDDLLDHKKDPDHRHFAPFNDKPIPVVTNYTKPLRIQCEHFLECIRNGKEPVSGAMDILEVTRMAEIAQRSLECHGMPLAYSRIRN